MRLSTASLAEALRDAASAGEEVDEDAPTCCSGCSRADPADCTRPKRLTGGCWRTGFDGKVKGDQGPRRDHTLRVCGQTELRSRDQPAEEVLDSLDDQVVHTEIPLVGGDSELFMKVGW